ncbi:MAG: 23S rRNA (guanosine(2251)-2'-O)-methyltransferase RlmB [Cyclobacteriaceae bacterium]|nr:23S rRNA (guanosine(2251)-2'-O)-methyltransferase RlmB [Cyclobacteriaceae bacterium]
MRNYAREHQSDNFIFGIHAISEAIEAAKDIEKVLVQRGAQNEQIKGIVSKMKGLKIPFNQVPLEKLNSVTKKNHQGIIAYISPIQYASLDHVIENAYSNGKDPFLVILDRITDVRNFGAIARSIECAGADAIVMQSRGNAMIGADAMKTSAGALNMVPVCREENLKDTIMHLKSSGIRVIACTEKTDKLIYETELDGPLAIIMGSEEDGISPEYLKLCDALAKIPIVGKIESLNVSVSTGIILYEAWRQRQAGSK